MISPGRCHHIQIRYPVTHRLYQSEKKNLMNQAYKTAGQQYRVIDDDSFGVIVPYKKGDKIIEAIQNAVDPAVIPFSAWYVGI